LFPFTATVVDSGNPTRTATRNLTLGIAPRQTFLVQPASTNYLEPLTPPVQVQLTDGNNNPVAGVTVALTLGTNPNGATLVGDISNVSDANGLVTFPNVRPSRSGTFTLVPNVVFSPSFIIPGPASNSFTVSALGRQFVDPADNGTLDLRAITATTDGATLTLDVRYGTGFDPTRSRGSFSLDIDQDVLTGHPGIDSGGTRETQAVGVDYIVRFNADFNATGQNTATVFQYAGSLNSFNFVGTVAVTRFADGYAAAVPLSMLGNDDGLLNLKVTSSVAITEFSFTGILDVASDEGLAPITITPAGVVEQQSVTKATTNYWSLGGVLGQRVAQVITPGITGFLTELRLPVDSCAVTVQIQGVTAGQPNGVVLGSRSFAATDILTASEPFRRLALPQVPVLAGTQVAIVLDSPQTCGIAQGPDANFYSGGSSFFRQTSMNGWLPFNATQDDLPFQVIIRP